jgi:WD40 repeat protein
LRATLGEKDLTDHSAVSCVAFSPDGRTLASASGEQIRVWDVATGGGPSLPLRRQGDAKARGGGLVTAEDGS